LAAVKSRFGDSIKSIESPALLAVSIKGRYVEAFGKLHLVESLVAAGFIAAEPVVDIGFDIIACDPKTGRFAAIQLKVSTDSRFSIDARYKDSVTAFVWNYCKAQPEIFALTFAESREIAEEFRKVAIAYFCCFGSRELLRHLIHGEAGVVDQRVDKVGRHDVHAVQNIRSVQSGRLRTLGIAGID
jgi:hypothetical protein